MQLEELRRMAATLGDVLPIDLLPEPDRLELVSHMAVRKFKQDEVVYHQGDPAEHAYVVFEGLVKVLLLDEQGHELLVSIMRRGEFFGELALFEKAPRDGTAMAIIPTTALQIERDGALRVLRRNPEASRFMFERLSRTIRTLEVKAEDLAFLDVTSRLAKYLLEIAKTGLPLPLTQDDLAAAIGSTRMTVNKLLADFEKRGLIDVERRNVRVIDEALLLREVRP
ncbi:MAG: Crp/Fnr family transcriptional regulator [Chloroflexi bacterium]|nr:MAG: Crp/Fnr family transcriptional regulator [Chloroflexota bacterium]